MAKRADPKPATVPFGATPARQPPSLKEWVNRHVWTDRMLDTLQTGVRGGKWPLAKCLLHRAWTVESGSSPCEDVPVPDGSLSG